MKKRNKSLFHNQILLVMSCQTQIRNLL